MSIGRTVNLPLRTHERSAQGMLAPLYKLERAFGVL